MKISRILCGLFAALTIGILVAGISAIDPATAAGFGSVTMAMATMVTIKAPVTMHNGEQYVAPGTEITLTQEEAASIEKRFGKDEVDPGSTLRKTDIASIEALNEHSAINKGNGKPAGGGNKVDELPKLKGMSKPELIEQAVVEGVTLEADDTMPVIIEKIEAHRAKA